MCPMYKVMKMSISGGTNSCITVSKTLCFLYIQILYKSVRKTAQMLLQSMVQESFFFRTTFGGNLEYSSSKLVPVASLVLSSPWRGIGFPSDRASPCTAAFAPLVIFECFMIIAEGGGFRGFFREMDCDQLEDIV